jgi:GST-like protein
MSVNLSAFPITRKWPPRHTERLQLYTLDTPNGRKISIFLEESGLPYEAHKVSFSTNDQMSAEFLSLNPNNKIPAIIDPEGPGGVPLPLFESGAILIYLAEKTGRFLSQNPAQRYTTLQWLMFQMGNVGPLFGQLGFFHKYAGAAYEDKRPRDRYAAETRRQLGVMDSVLAQNPWIAGQEYSIADMAIFPWIDGLLTHYQASELVSYGDFHHVERALRAFLARPAVQRGMKVPA